MGRAFAGIIGLIVVGFLGLLMWAAERGKPKVDSDGTLIFRHSLLFRCFSVFMAVAVPVGIIVLAILKPPQKESEFWAMMGLCIGFAVLIAPLLWESLRFALFVSPEGIECRSPWRGSRFLPWKDVEEVSFRASNSWFVIRAKDYYKFRIHILVPGLSQFLEQCEQHLPPGALDGAEAGYRRVGRPFPQTEDESSGRRQFPGRNNPFA
jgi:hypothetical protein